MAKLKSKDLQTREAKELVKLIEEQRAKLRQLVIDSRTKKLSNVKEMNQIKKNVARALTTLRQQQLTAAQTKEAPDA
jgi:ribosomal protein L29